MEQQYINNMSGTAFSINTFLAGSLVVLVKLLMGVLIAAAIVGVIMWIKDTFFKNNNINTKILKQINDEPILTSIAGVTAAVLGGSIVFILLDNFLRASRGYGIRYSMGTFSSTLVVAGLLGFIIKVLSLILVAALILAVVTYIKKQYDQGVFSTQKTANNEVNDKEDTHALVLINEDNIQV